MMDAPESNALTFDGPALYRIRVRGEVPVRWSPRLEGMNIVVEASTHPPVSTLTGVLDDQASLAGVLRTLYELRMPVISVECVNAGRVQQHPTGDPDAPRIEPPVPARERDRPQSGDRPRQ